MVYVKEEFLSPILFAIYIDDLIKELRLAGFGVCVGAHYVGSMLYADDIALLAGSCYVWNASIQHAQTTC